MKIYILTDLEGVAMVSRFSQTREEGSAETDGYAIIDAGVKCGCRWHS